MADIDWRATDKASGGFAGPNAAPEVDVAQLRTFMGGMDLTPEQQDRLDGATTYTGIAKGKISEMFNYFTGAEEPAPQTAEQVVRGIIAEKTPAQFLNGLAAAHPEAADALKIIGADDKLTAALHNAAIKKETVLPGLASLVGEGSAITPEELKTALSDPKNRMLVTGMLNGLAESETLEFTDVTKALNAGMAFKKEPGNADKLKAYADSLAAFGLTDDRTEMAGFLNDPNKMLAFIMDALRDPMGAFNKLPDLMGMGPLQADEFRNNPVIKGIAMFVALPLEGPEGFGGPLAKGIQKTYDFVDSGRATQMIDRLSGEADRVASLAGDKNNVTGSVNVNGAFSTAAAGPQVVVPDPELAANSKEAPKVAAAPAAQELRVA